MSKTQWQKIETTLDLKINENEIDKLFEIGLYQTIETNPVVNRNKYHT